MASVVTQHIQTSPAEMGLRAAVVMQDVVIDLTGAVRLGEVDEPVTPSIWIVDGEGAHKWRADLKRIEHEALSRAQPPFVAHRKI
ncbi:hypothetical protein Brsp01_32510 [Brucella sp. NBRC 12950]|nr:hypothetical protein Brsp01_32510 [Brucella sp. NBRC 12950]